MMTTTCSVIGPQLSPRFDPCGIVITIALPHMKEVEQLTCWLRRGDLLAAVKVQSASKHFHSFVFSFNGLLPGAKYSYGFDQELDTGLERDECWFYGPEMPSGSQVALVSCNHPFCADTDEEWAMWERADAVLDRNRVKLLIQGGDQVYNDEIEAKSLRLLKKGSEEAKNTVRDLIIENYQRFYSNPAYRRILAQIPSLAMLDDHDITDGWGGRTRSFDRYGEFRPEWQEFFNLAYGAFIDYQAAKNPPVLCNGVATTYLDAGPNRFYLLDLRKQKNLAKGRVVRREHLDAILTSLDELPDHVRNVFMLFPVTPVRMDGDTERIIMQLAGVPYAVHKLSITSTSFLARFLAYWRRLFKRIAHANPLATLIDDITDALTYESNKPFMVELVKKLALLTEQRHILILSGDIHNGGVSEISVGDITIPQIVSSPIAHTPMAKELKDLITYEGDYTIADGITARNVFYRSDRNFVIFEPDGDTVDFYFESLRAPIRWIW